MTSPFVIQAHTFEGQHIREYRGALREHSEAVVSLRAKSYTPTEVAHGTATGDLTIIAFHANAFNKEIYEPYFEHLCHHLKFKHGLTIGSIWIADQANQGYSAQLNEDSLATNFHWFDHARDVLQMVNTFRSHMRQPIFGIGHSMGGTQAVATAHFHPGLFESVVMIDPPMTFHYAPSITGMFQFALRRPQSFKSRAAAAQFVRKNPFFKTWNSQVVDRYIETAFLDDHDSEDEEARVKFVTPQAAELSALARPNLDHTANHTPSTHDQRREYPDIDPDAPLTGPIYNPFTRLAFKWLPTLRPAALFLLGKGSRICKPEEVEDRTSVTGTAVGGSGGVKAGNVASMTVPGGHFLPMTNPDGTAEASAEWIADRFRTWRKAEDAFVESKIDMGSMQNQALDPAFLDVMKDWDGKPWHNPEAKADGGRSKL